VYCWKDVPELSDRGKDPLSVDPGPAPNVLSAEVFGMVVVRVCDPTDRSSSSDVEALYFRDLIANRDKTVDVGGEDETGTKEGRDADERGKGGLNDR